LKYLDIPQAVAMAAEKTKVNISGPGVEHEKAWDYPLAVAKNLGWNNQISILPVASGDTIPASSR
jgi:hypothetical protein